MSSISIRPMRKEDIGAVVQIEEACFSRPWHEKTIRESLENPIYSFFVAETEEKEVVGYISYYLVLDEGDICNVAVLEKARGQRIAQRLLDTLLKDAGEKGAKALVLEVRISNAPAIHIYEKTGFRPIGKRRDYYEEPREDALLLGCALRE